MENQDNRWDATPKREAWNTPAYSGGSKRILAGVLAIIFGSLGVHKFVLGYEKEGAVLLILTLIGYATICIIVGIPILSVTGIIGLIEGIVYLSKTDEEFYNQYQLDKKPWF